MKTSTYDMSGGSAHVRAIAEESGLDWMACHSNEKTATVEGFQVETWYDENSSSAYSSWCAFIKGVGTCSAISVEQATTEVIAKARNAKNKKP